MLWWLIGLWICSPVLLPIFWLLGRLGQSRKQLRGPVSRGTLERLDAGRVKKSRRTASAAAPAQRRFDRTLTANPRCAIVAVSRGDSPMNSSDRDGPAAERSSDRPAQSGRAREPLTPCFA